MKSVRTNLSAGLLLAALAMAATSLATAQEYTFTTLAGPDESPGAIDGTASAARFGGGFYGGPPGPCGVAVDSAGNVYVADSYNQTIRKVTPGGAVATLAGLAGSYGNADGTGSGARFNYPSGVAVDSAGNVYVADTSSDTIRKVTPGGVVTTLAGGELFAGPQGVAVDSAGNVYVADTWNNRIRKMTPGGVVTTLAGLAGNSGSADGTGSAAQFSNPSGVVVDSAGNVYVADTYNCTIRKVTPGGVVTTPAGLAGSWGSADGTGSAARFSSPSGVAVDSAGNVYVADTGNNTIRKVTPGGVVTTLAGNAAIVDQWGNPIGGYGDGTGSGARFCGPQGVAVDSASDVYVADTGSFTIRKVTPGGVVTTLAGLAGNSGSADGRGRAAEFNGPRGVAVESAGDLYVADTGNNTIRQVTVDGVVTTLAGLAGSQGGSADGTGSTARFSSPSGVAVDSAGNVYMADTSSDAIRKVTADGVVTTLATLVPLAYPHGVAVDNAGDVYVADTGNHRIRKVTPDGVVTTLAGQAGSWGSADGTGSAARFSYPSGVALDNAGNVYVADTGNHTIRKVTPGGVVTTLAGLAGSPGSVNGAGSAARFSYPSGVALDNAGNIYVADMRNNTLRKVTPGRVVTTLAGNAAIVDQGGNPMGGYADGTGSAAQFSNPSGMALDNAGNVYVADTGNNAIRKVTPGGVVTTLAGLAGSYGSDDATGSAARFEGPSGVAVDSAGILYVADTGNHTIRKVTPGGVVTTLAGQPGSQGSANGTGSTARFSSPSGVAVDSAGVLYVADTGNHTIRKVTAGGVVTTLAGLAGSSGSADGTGSAARFNSPSGVTVDSAGNVYVADTDNETIRKVTPDGVVSTLAGQAGSWGSADGTGSAAQFSNPSGVAVDGAGNVYVADFYNSTIRKVTADGVVTTLAGLAGNSGSADGTGSAALFCGPQGVAVDSAGNVYVADTWNRSIRKVTTGGVVTTLAGLAGSCGSANGTGSAARFGGYAGLGISAPAGPEGLAVDSAGNVYVADTYNSTIRLGGVACPDAPTIDRAVGTVGQLRRLDTRPQTAVAWQWRLIRAPSASLAALSATNVRNPTFVPDVADLYVFRLEATNAAGAICIRTLNFTAVPLPPTILPNNGSFGVRSNRFGFSVNASVGQVVVVESSTNLVNWTDLATITFTNGSSYFSDPQSTNHPARFYRLRSP